MALPVPNLDDRRFQDLVDDAKRLVQQRNPQWTDHNVSDPGVTLIETFAYMTDQLLFRLNRVPDRLYVKFLDLLGLRLLPPTPARAPVTFWLSSPATTPLLVSAGTKTGTMRTETESSVVFSTLRDLDIVPCSLSRVWVAAAGAAIDEARDVTATLQLGGTAMAFTEVPVVGDALLLGLSDPVPSCAVRIDFDGPVQGVGVNPLAPPLRYEAWTGESWEPCEVGRDETGGWNRPGAIVVHVPDGHAAHIINGERAGWLRLTVTEPAEGQPAYSRAPLIRSLTACTVGGTTDAVHADIVEFEALGESAGVAGQTFALASTPVLAGAAAPVVQVSSADGWQEWTEVEHFADSGPVDRHFVLDAVSGQVLFGPVVRQEDGTVRQYGAIPEDGQQIRIERYAVGGGLAGNVSENAIQSLKSSIPFVSGVENRRPAQGGVDGESLDEAKIRGPLLLRTRSRAVTAEDFEVITREVAPDIARVRCLVAGEGAVAPGTVKVLIVPAAAREGARIRFEDLLPLPQTLEQIAARLDEVRLVGTTVSVEPPLYRGVTVVTRLIARPRVNINRVRDDALAALYDFLSPLPGGGPGGGGWPFGRPVQTGEIFSILQQVHGVEMVEDVRLFAANPVSGERGKESQRLNLESNSLVFSFEHHVRIEEH
ncbi:MAG TPA: putative baseplate assembly protein [Mycobacteriales bacterium]|nr:putative baseplate assembly protein [Mycobacteriales bacterium]